MTNTITIDRADLRDLVWDYQDICLMLESRSAFHLEVSPMILIRSFRRQCEEIGVFFFGTHKWAMIEEVAAELQAKREAEAEAAFGD